MKHNWAFFANEIKKLLSNEFHNLGMGLCNYDLRQCFVNFNRVEFGAVSVTFT